MPIASLLAIDLPAWEIGLVSLIALASAGLGLYAGRLLFRQSKTTSPGAAPAPDDADAQSDAYWAERRASPRHKVRQVKVVLMESAPNAQPLEGWLMNRSLGGLGLSVSRAVDVGALVKVRTVNDSDITPWVQVEVRYCRLERGRWTLGCKFVDPLPSNSLLFG